MMKIGLKMLIAALLLKTIELERVNDTLKVVPLVSIISPSFSSNESTPRSPRSTCSGSSVNNSPQLRKMNYLHRFPRHSARKLVKQNSGKMILVVCF
jgi:hypothetical protein